MQHMTPNPLALPQAKCVPFFEVKGRVFPEGQLTPDGKLAIGKRASMRVTANDLYEALVFIRERKPGFLFTTVRHLGHIWITPNTIPFEFPGEQQPVIEEANAEDIEP